MTDIVEEESAGSPIIAEGAIGDRSQSMYTRSQNKKKKKRCYDNGFLCLKLALPLFMSRRL